mgnify:CR=1 FL=1
MPIAIDLFFNTFLTLFVRTIIFPIKVTFKARTFFVHISPPIIQIKYFGRRRNNSCLRGTYLVLDRLSTNYIIALHYPIGYLA